MNSESLTSHGVQLLLQRNQEFKDKFKNNLLFKLSRTQRLDSTERKERFLAYFQVWSDHFQKAMLLKTALCDDPHFIPLFDQHFREELGHDKLLKSDRKTSFFKRDAILEAVCHWFPSKMLSFNLCEQILVMNLVVEGSAVIFYENIRPVLDPQGSLKHFQLHTEELDSSHESLGLDLLEGLSKRQFDRLLDLQEQSWAMLEAVMGRIGELCSQDS